MPTAQFVRPHERINKSVRFPTPRRSTEVIHWINEARRHIPEIPALGQSRTWFIAEEIVAGKIMVIKIMDRNTRETASIAINRDSGGRIGG